VVTAVLNLDTAVAFLTPVLVLAARRRRTDETAFLYLAVSLANAASVLLPGSNLTNLIVLGDRHLSGGAFAATMFPVFVAASLSVTAVVALVFRRALGQSAPGGRRPLDARVGVGLGGWRSRWWPWSSSRVGPWPWWCWPPAPWSPPSA